MPARVRTVAVASGKGGTGKTLVATGLAAELARRGLAVTLADCDVEAPNDHLFFSAELRAATVDVPLAETDAAACTLCGACRDACAYGAVRLLGGVAVVFPELCHGCGACVTACPTGAMGERPRRVGEVGRGVIAVGPGRIHLVAGTLDIGEVKAPDVIRATRRHADAVGGDIVVIDAPPGTSCSAVAATRGADLLVLVTEPTAFGVHDLALAAELGRALGIPLVVVENRAGSGPVDVSAWCLAEKVPLVASIPFDRAVAEAYAQGRLPGDEVRVLADALAILADHVLGEAALA
ncbi:MAG: ATP-binding protein [Coriobacteriia bacterium]